MSMESGPKLNRFESMGFEELEKDPEYNQTLQEVALEYLKTEDREYFEREFSGELDDEGYLFRKDGGNSNTKPSQNLGDVALRVVLEKTKEWLRNQVG